MKWGKKGNQKYLYSRLVQVVFKRKIGNKKEQGYFLIELAVAFSVLLLIVSTVIPIWLSVQEHAQERTSRSLALGVAQNEVEQFYAAKEPPEVGQGEGYTRSVSQQDQLFQVSWEEQRGREDDHSRSPCGSAQTWVVEVKWEKQEEKEQTLQFQLCRS